MVVKLAVLTFTKNLSNLTVHIQIDHKVALSYLLKMGGTDSLELLKNQQVNLALSAVSWDHNYCRIFTKQIECPSRLGV